jgi:hypothetical protein
MTPLVTSALFRFEGSPIARSERKGFVPCDHEYLNLKGAKLSKSRGTAVEVPYFLSKYDPDLLREPALLFEKLDESLIDEEYARLEG